MKKLLAVLISMCLAVSMLAACTVSSPDENDSKGTNTVAPTSDDSQGDKQGDVDTDPGESQTEATEKQISFEKITVVDNEECSINIVEIDADGFWGYTLKVNFENKSEDKNYMFSVVSAAVDGVQSDPFFATEVAAGKKAVDSVSFTDSILEDNDVQFTDIELTFRVYDSDDWMADDVAHETVHVYPFGEENAQAFVRPQLSSDNVIIDNEYVTVTVIGYDADSIWGYTVNLFIENKTDTEVMFSIGDASVNGYMADPFWATSVLPGKCAFDSVTWYDSTLEEIEVTEVEEIEFTMRAYDNTDWLADDFANETVTLNP